METLLLDLQHWCADIRSEIEELCSNMGGYRC